VTRPDASRTPLRRRSYTNALLLRILQGTPDANIRFDELVLLLKDSAFDERIRGSHHIFTAMVSTKS
jgi:hypothetical protein